MRKIIFILMFSSYLFGVQEDPCIINFTKLLKGMVDKKEKNFISDVSDATIKSCNTSVEKYPEERKYAYCLGYTYYLGNDFKKAFKYLKKATDKGHRNSIVLLGIMYSNGQGVKKDQVKAFNFIKKACEAGDKQGCSSLGIMYAQGIGTSVDYQKAIQLSSQACEEGFESSCNMLGLMYNNGNGLKEDPKKALEYYKKSCDLGNATGCKLVEEHYSSPQRAKTYTDDDIQKFNFNTKELVSNALTTLAKTPSLYKPIKFDLMLKIDPSIIKEVKLNEFIFHKTAYLVGMEFHPAGILFSVTYNEDIVKYFLNNPDEIIIVHGSIRDVGLDGETKKVTPMFVIDSIGATKEPVFVEDQVIVRDRYRMIKHAIPSQYEYTYEIHDSCEVAVTSQGKIYGSKRCLRDTGPRGEDVYCSNDKKVCKTDKEIIREIRTGFNF